MPEVNPHVDRHLRFIILNKRKLCFSLYLSVFQFCRMHNLGTLGKASMRKVKTTHLPPPIPHCLVNWAIDSKLKGKAI